MSSTPVGMGEAAALPTETLNTYIGNPRRGDVAAIRDSLEAHGQFRPIVVNRGSHTGRSNEVLAGNHTLIAARALGWETIDCYVVDVDHDHAAKIVLADNRTGDLSEYDDRALLELLRGLDDTDGTGYDDDDVADLIALEEENAPAFAPEQAHSAPEAPTQATTPESDPNPADGHTEHPVGNTPGPEDTHNPGQPEPTRMFAIHFPINQFVWVQDALEKWHEDHPEAGGANSVAIHTLLTRATA